MKRNSKSTNDFSKKHIFDNRFKNFNKKARVGWKIDISEWN